MEIQFQKMVVPYLQTLANQVQTQEQTQQVRLSDTMPDMGKVLACWGQVLLRGKEWRSDSFGVSGGVKAWVLYLPEDGTKPCCVESWLPFQMKWNIPDTERDGTVIACPMTPSVDARMLSDRKLMVRANVSIHACAYAPAETQVHIPDSLPEDVQMLSSTYPMLLPAEAGEKSFDLEETISLPSVQQPMETLIRYDLEPVLAESKVVADKLVMRAMARLQMLYMGTDGRLHTWATELSFSQYAQLDEAYDSSADVQICFAVTGLELLPAEGDDLVLKAGITAQYTVFNQKSIQIAEDLYSPYRSVKVQREQICLPSVLDRQERTVRAEVTQAPFAGGIVDVVWIPAPPEIHREDDRQHIQLSGNFQMLGMDEEGALCSEKSHWEEQVEIPVADDADMIVRVRAGGATQPVGNLLRAEQQLELHTVSRQAMDTVAGAELGEMTEPDPNRPSLILRRAGDMSLWELAKQTGSTVEEIRKLNGLQQDPPHNQMLLIPVL